MVKIFSVNDEKIKSDLITINSKIRKGLTKLYIEGLNSVSLNNLHSKFRQSTNSHSLKYPYGTISIQAQSKYKKFNNQLELPMLLSIILDDNRIKINLSDYIIIGELDIYGNLLESINPYNAILLAKKFGIKNIIMPIQEIYFEYPEINIWQAGNISDVINHIYGLKKLIIPKIVEIPNENLITFNDVISNGVLIRALIIAISGKHNILITGPIGSGKNFTINASKSILPKLNLDEHIIVSDIYSKYFKENIPIINTQLVELDFLSNKSKIFGNNSNIGKIELANHNIIFIDEINHWDRDFINKIKNIIDNRILNNSCIIATKNPCPCGKLGTSEKCNCSMSEISKHNRRIDQSLLDRFSMRVQIDIPKTYIKNKYEISEIRNMIQNAKLIQEERYRNNYLCNGNLNNQEISEYITLSDDVKHILTKAQSDHNLSIRKLDNIIKVARTIADLESSKDIKIKHILEAFYYK